jgi:hypothetical protein
VRAYAAIFLASALETLAASALQPRKDVFLGIHARVCAAHYGEILARTYQHLVLRARKTLCKAEQMHCVEQVALAHAVVAEQRIHLRRKFKARTLDVFEIRYVERPQNHRLKTSLKNNRW